MPSLEILNELVKAGADYSYKLKTGLTVSDFAQRYGGSESYSTLCSRDTTISQGKLKHHVIHVLILLIILNNKR